MINDRFLKACRREPVDCTPVWFMRQAGRYMAEYRALRAKHSILELCKTPELAVQVTLQPIDRFPLDAAIIFADILLPLEPMGLSLEFAEGEGPVIYNPVRDQAGVELLKVIDGGELDYVAEAVRQARRALNGRVPLIGFAGEKKWPVNLVQLRGLVTQYIFLSEQKANCALSIREPMNTPGPDTRSRISIHFQLF